MKRFLLLLASALLTSLAGYAYKAGDLVKYNQSVAHPDDNRYADGIEIRYGNYNQRALHDGSTGKVEVFAYDDNTIQIKGLLNGNTYAIFKVDGNKLILREDGQFGAVLNQFEMTEKALCGEPIDSPFSSAYYTTLKGARVDAYGNYTTRNGDYWTGTITMSETGAQIDFNNPLQLMFANSSGYFIGATYNYNRYSIIIPRFNGSASDTYQNDNAGWYNSERSYGINVSMLDSDLSLANGNEFGIVNFGWNGFAIKNYLTSGNPNILSRLDHILGFIDWQHKKVTVYSQQGMSDVSKLQSGTEVMSYTVSPVLNPVYSSDGEKITGGSISKGDDIKGEITETTLSHHESCANFWHEDCLGDLKTTLNATFELEPYVYYNQSSDTYYGPYHHNIYSFEQDCTHNVRLNLLRWASTPDGGLLFAANATDKVNADLVEGYDICIVRGQYSSIDEFSSAIHTLNGHNEAFVISGSQYDYSITDMPASDNLNYFIKRIPVEDLPDDLKPTKKGDRNYTLYLRARYSTAAMPTARQAAAAAAAAPATLNPSFHSLTRVTDDITSGIEAIDSYCTSASVTVSGREISISGSNGHAVIAHADGTLVYSGGDATVSVLPGIYVVRAASVSKRVLVK